MRKVRCPTCEGSGVDTEHSKEFCKTCFGEGYVPQWIVPEVVSVTAIADKAVKHQRSVSGPEIQNKRM
jgi:DnaJ-class molecular chaperone